MKIKKSIISFSSILMILPFISAYIDFRQGMNQVLQWIQDFLTPVFEILVGDYSGREFFLAKCLMLILLYAIIYFVLLKSALFKGNKIINIIIASIISILSIRFIPENDFFTGMLLPYSTLGVALLTFIPFFIYFFFVYNSVPTTLGRRIAWIIYGAAFAAITYVRWPELGSNFAQKIQLAGLILVMIIVIVDPLIRGVIAKTRFHGIIRRLDQASANNKIMRITQIENTTNWDSIPSLVNERIRLIRELEQSGYEA